MLLLILYYPEILFNVKAHNEPYSNIVFGKSEHVRVFRVMTTTVFVSTRKYPLRRYIPGVLTHTTA